jgi:hypothetical protein
MVGSSDTLGSPWIPLEIRPCAKIICQNHIMMLNYDVHNNVEWRRHMMWCDLMWHHNVTWRHVTRYQLTKLWWRQKTTSQDNMTWHGDIWWHFDLSTLMNTGYFWLVMQGGGGGFHPPLTNRGWEKWWSLNWLKIFYKYTLWSYSYLVERKNPSWGR